MQGVIYLKTQKTDDPKNQEPQEIKKGETPKTEHIPEIAQRAERVPILDPDMASYIARYKEILEEEKHPPTDPIVIDEIVSKIAKFYEKVRRIIDWKEENLMRRTAIERILKRRLISEISGINILPDLDPQKIAEPMTAEIVRTGYFQNGKISEERSKDVERILSKYLYILKNSSYAKEKSLTINIKVKVQFYNWLLEIAACEIDEALDKSARENLLIDFMTESLIHNTKIIPEGSMSQEEAELQMYIAVHRALFGLDSAIITYHVLKRMYSQYETPTPAQLEELTNNISQIWADTQKILEHPKRGEFLKICEKYDAVFTIIADTMKELEPKQDFDLIKDKGKYKELVTKVYNSRLETLKKRLFRSAIYSTLSIFVAGAASLIIFEYPVAKFFYGSFAPKALVADIGIPTGLMFFLVGIIKPPAEGNLEALLEETFRVTYFDPLRRPYKLKLNKRIKKVMNIIFSGIYLAGGFGSLYLIYWIYKVVGTPLTSLYINTANIAVIVFAAMAIRQKSKEITIKEKGSVLEFILDFFSIPLARIGGWFSSKWKEFNFVSVFFSTLVDTPVSTFIELLEEWRTYIKDKQAEIN